MMLLQPAAPCLVNAVAHKAQLLNAVGIGVNRDFHADLPGSVHVYVIQVETVRLSV
jgi:hypothetical protein